MAILKARPHGSLLISPIRSFQHWSLLFLMLFFRAPWAFFYASSSAESSPERVYLSCAARHSPCTPDKSSFYQYMDLLTRLCPRRNIQWSHATITVRLVARILSNNSADFTYLSSSMSLVSSRRSRNLSLLSRLVSKWGLFFRRPCLTSSANSILNSMHWCSLKVVRLQDGAWQSWGQY